MVAVYIACDGTEFMGDDAEERCISYEQEEIFKKIEKDMDMHVIIHNKEYFFNESDDPCYIKFLDEMGKELFLKWCAANEIILNTHEKDDIEIRLLNKFYRVYADNSWNCFYIARKSLDEQIDALVDEYYKINSLYSGNHNKK